MPARMLTMKEMGGNLIPPGDTAQTNRTNNGGGRALDNDDVEYDNTRMGNGWPASMIGNKDDCACRSTRGGQQWDRAHHRLWLSLLIHDVSIWMSRGN